MPTVYIVNEPRKNSRTGEVFDTSQAEDFGEVVIVFDDENFRKPSKDPKAAMEHARRILDGITEDDYILYAGGDVLGLAMVAMIADDALDGRTRFLRWDKERDSDNGLYRVIEIENY